MKEYMVYTNGEAFRINADRVSITDGGRIMFHIDGDLIAAFNWANIIGWEEVKEG